MLSKCLFRPQDAQDMGLSAVQLKLPLKAGHLQSCVHKGHLILRGLLRAGLGANLLPGTGYA